MELSKQHLVIDVRSPGEYNHAHMPGAHSLTLFTDDERAVVGTTYKQKSREEAIKVGLDFFGPKMKAMVEEMESIIQSRDPIAIGSRVKKSEHPTQDSRLILLYCWRGGMRSAAVAWLLDLYGFKIYTLAGGYKKFRNYVLESFRFPYRFKILGGFTGSGKTKTLKALKQKGECIIDLEEIANHKGSAFGNIGMPEQPGQEMFENLLCIELRALSIEQKTVLSKTAIGEQPAVQKELQAIWLEDESQRIGHVNIPTDIWSVMRKSPVYFLDIPFDQRLQYLVEEYGRLDKQQMITAIGRIREKLGGENCTNAIQLLEAGKIAESFRILLAYYDKFYLKALHNRKDLNSLLTTIHCETVTAENAHILADQPQYQFEKA